MFIPLYLILLGEAGAELGQWYADTNPSDADTVLVRLTPEKWRTCDFGKAMA